MHLLQLHDCCKLWDNEMISIKKASWKLRQETTIQARVLNAIIPYNL